MDPNRYYHSTTIFIIIIFIIIKNNAFYVGISRKLFLVQFGLILDFEVR